jgi:hypothetical protein
MAIHIRTWDETQQIDLHFASAMYNWTYKNLQGKGVTMQHMCTSMKLQVIICGHTLSAFSMEQSKGRKHIPKKLPLQRLQHLIFHYTPQTFQTRSIKKFGLLQAA